MCPTSRSDAYFEHRETKVRKGAPVYMPFEQVIKKQGYQSVFGVLGETASHNIAREKSSGLYPVFCDVWLVDLDKGEGESNEEFEKRSLGFKTWLLETGRAFSHYHSGGRSHHYHIAIQPMYGIDVPFSIRSFAEKLPWRLDCSFYVTTGQFRLPGTKHERTGLHKTLIGSYRGTAFSMPRVPLPVGCRFSDEGNDFTDSTIWIQLLFQGMVDAPSERPSYRNQSRYQECWHIADGLLRAKGLSGSIFQVTDPVNTAILVWELLNGQWKDPKDDSEKARFLSEIRRAFP